MLLIRSKDRMQLFMRCKRKVSHSPLESVEWVWLAILNRRLWRIRSNRVSYISLGKGEEQIGKS